MAGRVCGFYRFSKLLWFSPWENYVNFFLNFLNCTTRWCEGEETIRREAKWEINLKLWRCNNLRRMRRSISMGVCVCEGRGDGISGGKLVCENDFCWSNKFVAELIKMKILHIGGIWQGEGRHGGEGECLCGGCKSCLHILTCGLTSTPPKFMLGSILEIASCKSSLALALDMFDDLRRCGGCVCFGVVC